METFKQRQKPDWLKIQMKTGPNFRKVLKLVRSHRLHTVCEEAHCPNRSECWEQQTATFMILGDRCTRSCRFCAVNSMPQQVPDMTEPERVAEAVAILGLRYCVITSVTRDDLTDGGAELWALTIMQIRKWNPNCMVEILVPDFGGNSQSLMTVINARPDVFGHNLETVRSRYPAVRPQADYDRSLMVLEQAARAGLITKTGVMLGLGETGQDLDQLMKDVRLVGCMSITFGQYLQPSIDHLPVDRYIAPSEFKDLETRALMEGFQFVMSGPLVRSSFCADKIRPFLPVK